MYTRNLISKVYNPFDNADYTGYNYDTSGRLTGMSTATASDSYGYDVLNRLKSYTISGSTVAYAYDGKNNLTTETATDRYGAIMNTTNYTYNANGQLTAVNNEKYFRYDALGNMTMYKGDASTGADNMTWCEGNKLAGGTINGNNFTYEYDPNGMRYKKTVNGAETEYYLDGGRITAEYRKGENVFIYYYYDQTGIAGMNYGGTNYYFDKNILGDVMKIYNASGIEVGSYSYDPWGEVQTISGGMAEKNAFRYRGYYCDTETGFYYLQTRYYDPSIRRFISADNYELIPTLAQTLGQLNMYVYCNNNPVMYTDETGEFILLSVLLSAIIAGAVAGAVYGGVTAYLNGENILAGILIGAISGGLMGAVAACATPLIFTGGWATIGGIGLSFVGGGLVGFVANVATQAINGKKIDWGSATKSGVVWGIATLLTAVTGGIMDKENGFTTNLAFNLWSSFTYGAIGLGADVMIGQQSKNEAKNTIQKYYVVGV